ncbi:MULTISPECIES: TolC family protein [Chryseobacterium]|uniref:Outer membrane protein TolC n=1 Tax=Chryseobacterium camelliae TaxID=1265445 RepID=A0ABU0TKD2_9FLAO|nr:MULTISPECIES: TolC family protein [Chryseobacterium]MDT3408637.1 outer membrane protein TolC [Pseudacidovorax intermedius]MDQ1097508.1 outer membrane protein TolC [Chryseobacterium camelliae]MDQ1101437.1 outer membrane protein TolC [Chryseobacterium sp. SORGH_AS_1048]MDR6084881.1 outer membrane protein TolC [Chryseobacterium sp. SORGH_AS_0909]MDR6129232.1 outer membrane protein TolC [Chryseobacterium sp. SORGH_AS_1175]
MKNRSRIIIIFTLLFSQLFSAQDSLRISAQEFIAIVKAYHPLAIKYQLQNSIAESEITRARGNFDPVLGGKLGEKNIDGVQYYRQKNLELGIPTWYGIDLTASYNYLDGEKINNSDTKGGLYQFGITIPLAKNLLYDKRRAMLEQAKYALKMTEAEQAVLTNDLLLEAENTYWEWVKNFEIYRLQQRAVAINKSRLELTKRTYEFGERPAIDTVEAASQLQSFQLQERDAFLNFVKSTQDLQLFLWKDNQEMYDMTAMIYPADRMHNSEAYSNFEMLVQHMEAQDPDRHLSVLYYFQKGNILESEKRLKWQSFLPKLDFTYNFFNKENYQADYLPLFDNNFQYGLKLEIPVFQREAKANYQIAKIKIEQNALDTQVKRREIETKIQTYKNEILNYHSQIDIARNNLTNYQRLLQAEETRYSNGESSLFLINSRENKMIDAQEKFILLNNKFLKSYNKLKWMKENFQF